MKDDPEIYFQKLQAIANEQDKAKLTTLAMEFSSTLARLPTINTELQQLLAETRPLDYDGLVSRMEPSLIQATALLEEIDFLPPALKDDEDLSHFIETALQQLTFRTVASVDQRFREQCEEIKLSLADAAASEAKRIADEKAAAERKEKAEAKQKAEAEAKRVAQAKLNTLAAEFSNTLARLPKINTEIQQMLVEMHPMDYDGLVSRIEPSLIQATALLEEIDFLPQALKDDDDLSHFTETALQQVTLRTVASVDQRFREQCEETKQAQADAAAREAKRMADEKAAAERKAKAEAKRKAAEAKQKAEAEAKRLAEEKAEAERKAKAEVKRIAQAKAAAKKKAKEDAALKRAIPSEMVTIPAGSFTMGNVQGRDDVEGGGHSSEEPAHKVKVESFLIGKYPVTFAEFDAYCELSGFRKPRDVSWGRGSRPLVDVSWNNIQQYIDWLKEVTRQHWRLPSEAEWEYAARGGNDKTAYPWGQKAEAPYANYGNSVGCITPVGEYPPNGFGLYDMHGNVWEWCQDRWHNNYQGAPDTGIVWAGGRNRVSRGGSYGLNAVCMRSASRSSNDPDARSFNLGARLALGQV